MMPAFETQEGIVKSRLLTGVLGVVIGVTCVTATTAQSGRRYINERSDTAYLSGVLGSGETAEAAATAGLNNLKATLTAAGMTMDDLVSVQIFTPDLAAYADFNKVYRTFFTKEFPARAFIGSGPLLNGAKFEIMGVAVKR
jgi:2-iminobutanoate/2-iminopropanoate deaminase